jgi:1,4-dihydroxy-2-naphthoyl-CoA hydrolase
VAPSDLTGIPPEFTPVIPIEESFDAAYGLELLDDGTRNGTLAARVLITDELRQQFGLVHGGVIASVAETLASRGTWMGAPAGHLVMGMSNDSSFLRPLSEGHLHACASPVHQGRTRWQWRVECRDDAGRLCAVSTVNIAVRPFPAT